MAHRKEEYEANGHEVTIQQVNEGGGISAWIDGKAAHAEPAKSQIPIDIQTKTDWDEVHAIVSFMVNSDVYYCTKCDSLYDYTTAVGTGFAGHKCGECAREDNHCPDSPDGDHEDKCLNPRQKRNARVATKYKCKHCGRKRRTTPTG
jgi:hypothetical protein